MLIGFLFNHDHIHQVAHSLPIALALAQDRPQHRIVLAVTSEPLAAEVVRLAGAELNRPNIELRRLAIGSRARCAIVRIMQPVVPAAKFLVYGENLDFFRRLDALVVSEKTSLVLKTIYGLDRLRMIHTRHGAGDRAIGFDRASASFDLVLASGRKTARRLTTEAGVPSDRVRMVGYPKFDLPTPGASPFADGEDVRPIVLYNPHVSPHLSSWYKAGPRILDWFRRNPAYRLIFAPHVMLFRRDLVVTVDPLRIGRPGKIAPSIAAAPNIHVDLGSAASTDMTYLEAADIYLGDASSQVYEFLRRPRPCIFFDAHRSRWESDPNFSHWKAGRVIEQVGGLGEALARCRLEHQLRYHVQQRKLFDETFDLKGGPSAVRAARAITRFLDGDRAAPSTTVPQVRTVPSAAASMKHVDDQPRRGRVSVPGAARRTPARRARGER